MHDLNTQKTKTTTVDQMAGLAIVRIRKCAGLTQKDLAARLEYAQPALSRIERGESKINIGMLWRLAGALDIQPEAILQEQRRIFEANKKAPRPQGQGGS